MEPFQCGLDDVECLSGSTLISETPTSPLTKVAIINSRSSMNTSDFWIIQSIRTSNDSPNVERDVIETFQQTKKVTMVYQIKEQKQRIVTIYDDKTKKSNLVESTNV